MICIKFPYYTPFFMLCTALLLTSCHYEINITNDTDGDGVVDDLDGCPDDPKKIEAGNCGCGKSEETVNIDGQLYCLYPEDENRDKDRDGVANNDDLCPNKAFKYTPGFCGCDRYDLDLDMDGIVDTCEPLDGDASPYIPEDGLPDGCPKDRNKTKPGICGCGVEDIDQDGDEFIDSCGENGPQIVLFPDRCPNDPQKQKPGICGCGIPDDDEDEDKAIFCGENHPNTTDHCPDDHGKTEPGICGCGIPDDDDDADGAIFCGENHPNTTDECPDNHEKQVPGICGCGTPDTDSDGDGTPDCNDNCPNDKHKTEPGICGCTIPDEDDDLDGAIFCGDDHPSTQDKCPYDPDKQVPGVCGCNIPDDDTDMDGYVFCGDDHPSTQDKCPYDSTRQDPGICGCGSPGKDGEVDIEENGETKRITVCIENGGILQVGPTPNACTDDMYTMIDAFNKRSVPTLDGLSLFYVPAGNLLTNPFLEQNDDGWRVSQGFGITAEELGSYEPSYAAVCEERPFGMYPVLQTHSEGTTFEQGIKLSACTDSACEHPLTIGMFAFIPDDEQDKVIQINLTGEGLSCPSDCKLESKDVSDMFQFLTLSKQIRLSDEEQVVTLHFAGKANNASLDTYDGAVLQYFGAWLGYREIRFSNDGTSWTPWQTFSPASSGSSDAWFMDWNLTAYGGNNMEGGRTVYMQTHDLLTDRYYETSSRIIYISPTELP